MLRCDLTTSQRVKHLHDLLQEPDVRQSLNEAAADKLQRLVRTTKASRNKNATIFDTFQPKGADKHQAKLAQYRLLQKPLETHCELGGVINLHDH